VCPCLTSWCSIETDERIELCFKEIADELFLNFVRHQMQVVDRRDRHTDGLFITYELVDGFDFMKSYETSRKISELFN